MIKKKKDIIKSLALHAKDVGSTEIQIGLLTDKISKLSENNQQLYIPEGFGHAFVVTSKSARVLYKVNNYYSPDHEHSIKFDDPTLDIKWPDVPINLSEKDSQADYINIESSFF